MKKLAVLVPWDSKFMFTHTAFNLMNLQHPEGFEVRYIKGDGWCPAARHNNAVGKAINWKADAMVFMGADHHCDEDVLVKLISHLDNGWDMACGWVPSRGILTSGHFPYVAWRKKNPDILPAKGIVNMTGEDWELISYGAESQEIHVIGTGILMFKIDVIKDMKKPWFQEIMKKDGMYGRIPAQDTYFVYRCTLENGHSLWLDTTINAQHLDIFAIDETYKDRFTDKEPPWGPTKILGISDEERGIYEKA